MQFGFSGHGRRVFAAHSGSSPGPISHLVSSCSQICPSSALGCGAMFTLLAPTYTSPGSRPWADTAVEKASAVANSNSRTSVVVMIPSQVTRSYTPNGLVDGEESEGPSEKSWNATPRGNTAPEVLKEKGGLSMPPRSEPGSWVSLVTGCSSRAGTRADPARSALDHCDAPSLRPRQLRPTQRPSAKSPAQLQVDALVLQAPLAALPHRPQRFAVVDLEVETRDDLHQKTDAHALEHAVFAARKWIAAVVARVADVVERREREARCPVSDPRRRRRDAQLRAADHAVVAHDLVLAVTAHRVAPADRELLEAEQRVVGDLPIGAHEQLEAE